MANSASDARNSEADIRKNLITSGVIDCMLTLPKNMFYTVTLPATLWFFDKSGVGKKDHKVLFIDARNIFRQVSRALREFTDEHIQNIATIVRLYRGETHRLTELLDNYRAQLADLSKQALSQQKRIEKLKKEIPKEEKEKKRWEKQVEEGEREYKAIYDKQQYFEAQINWLQERFPNGVYEDVTGLCKAATLAEIEEQDWSLNPGRYVGVVIEEDGLTEEQFLEFLSQKQKQLNDFGMQANVLMKEIDKKLGHLIKK
jgi:type I restriction enzyme M protein